MLELHLLQGAPPAWKSRVRAWAGGGGSQDDGQDRLQGLLEEGSFLGVRRRLGGPKVAGEQPRWPGEMGGGGLRRLWCRVLWRVIWEGHLGGSWAA